VEGKGIFFENRGLADPAIVSTWQKSKYGKNTAHLKWKELSMQNGKNTAQRSSPGMSKPDYYATAFTRDWWTLFHYRPTIKLHDAALLLFSFLCLVILVKTFSEVRWTPCDDSTGWNRPDGQTCNSRAVQPTMFGYATGP